MSSRNHRLDIPKDAELTAVLSDAHVPFQDEYAIDLVMKVLEYFKPKRVVLNGDWIDFWQISRFEKDMSEVRTLQDDIYRTHELFVELKQCAPNSEWYFMEGNHEHRLQRYLKTHPEIKSLKVLDIIKLLKIEELFDRFIKYRPERWTYTIPVDEELWLVKNELIVLHGNYTSTIPGACGRKYLNKYGISGISGHNHTMSSQMKRLKRGNIVWHEGGCLCKLNPDYMHDPDWHQGFVVVTTYKGRESFHIDNVPILPGYKCVVFGKRFTRKGIE